MWDPVSVLFVMWAMHFGMPAARLHVHDVVAANQPHIAVAPEAKACTIKK